MIPWWTRFQGFRISSSHIFSYSDTKRWRTTETASGFVRVYDGYVPKIQNFNLPARTSKTVYQKIYEAAEMGICPNSNVDFEAYEGVAIVFQIGEECKTEEMIFDRSVHPDNPNQVDAKPRKFRVSISFRHFLRLFQEPGKCIWKLPKGLGTKTNSVNFGNSMRSPKPKRQGRVPPDRRVPRRKGARLRQYRHESEKHF